MKYISIILIAILFSCTVKKSLDVPFPISNSSDEFGTFLDNVSHEEYVFFAKRNFNPHFNVFDSNNNASVNMSELKSLMTLLLPKEAESKWNKWR